VELLLFCSLLLEEDEEEEEEGVWLRRVLLDTPGAVLV
jgi:hypothetical protein